MGKCFWKWGTAVVPDEWCDHWLVYNHYDTTEGAAHVGHQNYFDVANLKGPDDARLLLQLQFDEDIYSYAGDLVVARRTWWDNPNSPLVTDVHWLEAENADARSFWAILGGLATCSAGDCLSDAANAAGYCQWQFLTAPVPPLRIWAMTMKGRYDVFAMVYTSDEVNTQYRLHYYSFGQQIPYYNQWVKQPNDLKWQMIYLGEVNADRFLRTGTNPNFWLIGVDYLKDALDTVRIDCIWLVNKAEPETRLHTAPPDWLTDLDFWVFDRTADFDYESKEDQGIGVKVAYAILGLQGDEMTGAMNPPEGQRFYFSHEEIDSGPTPDERYWIAHGPAFTPTMTISASYLPQYQTPLD